MLRVENGNKNTVKRQAMGAGEDLKETEQTTIGGWLLFTLDKSVFIICYIQYIA